LIGIWLHGRSPHTQRAHAADVARLCSRTGKPLAAVTLPDLQDFADSVAELSPASRYRALSAVKSLLAFGHPAESPAQRPVPAPAVYPWYRAYTSVYT